MENRLVSIAICTYNGEVFLKQQLDSLINQSYKNLEFIIVDDGSTDHTVGIIKQYMVGDSRIRLFENENNLGYVKNFEKAIGLCQGEYIALCDQDDIWRLDKIELLVANIGTAMLIYHDSQFINEAGAHLGKLSDVLNMYEGDSPLPLLFHNCISGHSCMFKKELVAILNQYGPFNPRFYHDWWIAFVAVNNGSIKYVNEALVNYRQHLKSNTDILMIKAESTKVNLVKYVEMDLPWLRNCYRVNGKCQQLIGQIISLLENKTKLNSITLLRLLLLNYKDIYFLKKKTNLSKINYLRKASFHQRAY